MNKHRLFSIWEGGQRQDSLVSEVASTCGKQRSAALASFNLMLNNTADATLYHCAMWGLNVPHILAHVDHLGRLEGSGAGSGRFWQ